MKIMKYGIVLLFLMTLWGCGKGNSNAPAAIDPSTGKHVVQGWELTSPATGLPPHATDATGYYAQPDSCKGCHGEDLSGGISNKSCFRCHKQPFPHGVGFDALDGPDSHAGRAKAAVLPQAGMAYCTKCHGSDYNGRSDAKSCIGCHKLANPTIATNAPHAAHWASYLANVRGLNHSTVAPSNAPACAQCHTNKANLSDAGKARVAGFTTPGADSCYNNSLCHNTAGHTFTQSDHMVPARSNLASCQSCHADPAIGANPRFTVPRNALLSPNGCENCHAKPGLAHPFMWLPGRGVAGQQNVNHGNAQNLLESCGLCHGGNALNGGPGYTPAWVTDSGIAPACFSTPASSISGTACHFTTPVNATTGAPAVCTSCHASPPSGAVAPNRNGRHLAHFANTTYNIAGLTCSACHSTYGAGTDTHATKTVFSSMTAPTKIDTIFYESNGVTRTTATYNPATGQCANVSCHGGKPNIAFGPSAWPAWGGGAFSQTNCYNCHLQRIGADPGLLESDYRAAVTAGTKPYIGPFSGKPALSGNNNLHFEHFFQIPLAAPTVCLRCHKTPGTGHFALVMTGWRVLPRGFAADTVGGPSTSVSTYVPGTGTCTTTCHATDRTWY